MLSEAAHDSDTAARRRRTCEDGAEELKMYKKIIQAAFVFFGAAMLTACSADAEDRDDDIPVAHQVVQNANLSKLKDICPSELLARVKKPQLEFTENCAEVDKLCLKQCLKGKGYACFDLAHVYVTTDKNYEASQLLFKRACQLGVASGCTNAAAGLLNIEGSKDGTCLLDSFKGACELEDPWGCTMSAIMLSDKRYIDIVDRNFDAALNDLKGSCTYGLDDPACSNARELERMIKEAIEK